MNWLGAGLTSFLAAILGSIVGAVVHHELLRLGIDFPPIIAIIAGVLAVLPSREASGLRGILVASFACWAGAIAEVLTTPARGLFWDLVAFNDRLSTLRFVLYALCAVVGIVLGSRARPWASAPAEQRGTA